MHGLAVLPGHKGDTMTAYIHCEIWICLMSVSPTRTAAETIDAEYLLIRAKLLEVAASLDRIERSEGHVMGDPRLDQIAAAVAILQSMPSPDHENPRRAEELQRVFSLPYQPDWRSAFGLA